MTKTYYYIEAMHIPARDPFEYDSVHLCVLDRKISFKEYVKLLEENENEIIVEENIDYPRLFKYYTTKAYAQQILKEINERKETKSKKIFDFPKVGNMLTDMITENFKKWKKEHPND